MDDDLVLVARYPTEDGATDAARSLVERGIGATVDRLPEAADAPGPPAEPPTPPDPPVAEGGSTLTTAAPTTPPDAPPDAAPAEAESPSDAAEAAEAAADSMVDRVPGEGRWGVFAVSVDARRAAVLLGFDQPAQIDDPDAQLDKPPVPWKPILVIWAIAMVVLPALGFLAAYYLAGS